MNQAVASTLLVVALGLPACVVRHDVLRPDEETLIAAGPDTAPMQLISNDTPEGEALLRAVSLPVRATDPAIARLLRRMLQTVQARRGVGIAAPQVGVGRRAILVQRLDQEPEKPFRPYINPRIETLRPDSVVDWEGCLSVPAGFGQVRRSASIVVTHDHPDGTRVCETVEGFTARIFQHEIDHLDGVLFIDRKEPGALMPETEYREMRRREQESPP